MEHRGIDGIRFETTPQLLAGYEDNPDNRCFCLEDPGHEDKCLGNGLLDLTRCMGKHHKTFFFSPPLASTYWIPQKTKQYIFDFRSPCGCLTTPFPWCGRGNAIYGGRTQPRKIKTRNIPRTGTGQYNNGKFIESYKQNQLDYLLQVRNF